MLSFFFLCFLSGLVQNPRIEKIISALSNLELSKETTVNDFIKKTIFAARDTNRKKVVSRN
jgi:hypothetical protein